MFDLDKYRLDNEIKTKVEGYEGFSVISNNSFLKGAWDILINIGRWYAWKFIFIGALTPLILITAHYMGTSKGLRTEKVADEMSSKAAGNNWFGALGVFNKNVVRKSTKFNEHPYYHLPAVKAQEKAFFDEFGYEIEVGKLFKYYTYDGQDYLIMKKEARGLNKDKIKLELSTAFSNDAEDYCDNFFNANIWDEDLKKVFSKKMMLKGISDELTQENDSGEKRFRCVIMPDTIEDALDD